MPNLTNSQLRDKSVLRAIQLERLKAHEARKVIELLKVVEADILAEVTRRLEHIATKGYILKSARIRFMHRKIKEIVQKGFAKLEATLHLSLTEIAKVEAKFAQSLLGGKLPKFEVLKEISVHRPMPGKLLADYLQTLSTITASDFKETINTGLVLRDTTNQINRSLRQRFARRFRKDSVAITKTAITHVSSQAREEVYKRSGIKRVQWVSVLDARTSDICISLDGEVFPVGEGLRPPAHLNCRSTTTPVVDGEPAKTITYRKWLSEQSSVIQDKVLGQKNGQKFRAGKLPFKKPLFIGSPITLEELGTLT